MSPQTLGILIGGLLPAFLFGYSNVAVKAATNAGLSVSFVLICAGLANLVVGAVLYVFLPEQTVNAKAAAIMFSGGLMWGISMACITIAIVRFSSPISVLTPLFNMNSLVAVLLALWLFAEWRQVHVPQLLIGTVFVVIGGALVAKA